MKKIVLSAACLALTMSRVHAQEAAPAQPAQVVSPAPATDLSAKLDQIERNLMKKLKDIEDRLDRLERDRQTRDQNVERKADGIQRDLTDMKRDIDRMQRDVERVANKR